MAMMGCQATLYDALGVKRSATSAEIRAAYLEQVRRHHPDKLQQLDSAQPLLTQPPRSADAGSGEAIHQINEAYETLMDTVARRRYDEKLAASSAATTERQPRISAIVDFDSFQPQDDKGFLSFTYPCRCGQLYSITEDQVRALEQLVHCDGCSEIIQIRYETES